MGDTEKRKEAREGRMLGQARESWWRQIGWQVAFAAAAT